MENVGGDGEAVLTQLEALADELDQTGAAQPAHRPGHRVLGQPQLRCQRAYRGTDDEVVAVGRRLLHHALQHHPGHRAEAHDDLPRAGTDDHVSAGHGSGAISGFANRSSAQRWKERSERADAALEESLAEVESTRAEVEDARERLRDLAARTADETDRNRILSEIVSQAPDVTEAMRQCQQETTALANEIIGSFGDPEAVPAIEIRIDEVNEICEEALDAASTLEASIDELGL